MESAEKPLVFGGYKIHSCPALDRTDVAMILDCRFDDCRILDVVLKDGRCGRIDSRTSPISIDAVMLWLKEGK